MTCWLYVRYAKLCPWKIADLAIPSGFLGLAYGRIGCFLNGDDFGKPVPEAAADAWWAVTFPNLKDGIARYPTQIIETFCVLVIVGFLILNFDALRKRCGNGAVGLVGAVMYAVYRFFAEYLRGDRRGWFIDDVLSTSQGMSLLVIIVCILMLTRLAAERRKVAL